MTEAAGGRVDKTRLTQVHRVLQQLRITLIPAYSPDAGGLIRAHVPDAPRSAAQRAGARRDHGDSGGQPEYLTQWFLPAYNRRVAVPDPEAGTAFVPWIRAGLADLLCVQDARVVANDKTVRYQGTTLQIPQDTHRLHYVKVTVRVHEYPERTLALFHGPRGLARYHAAGRLIETGGAEPGRSAPTHGSDYGPIVDPRPTVSKIISARG